MRSQIVDRPTFSAIGLVEKPSSEGICGMKLDQFGTLLSNPVIRVYLVIRTWWFPWSDGQPPIGESLRGE